MGICLAPGFAAAEVPLAKANDWTLTLDGRINTFGSYSFGDAQPLVVPTWQGIEDRAAGGDTIQMTRIRGGFISNVLGFTVVRPMGESSKLTARFAIWVGASQARNKSDVPALDAREVYLKVEGPWGGLLAGRNLALFSRGAILLDYDIEHAYGLGHPCSIRTVMGAACGHAGHGLLFPSYNAGFVYNTPELGGLQISVGAFDPASNSERTYERTPFPRVEGEATFHVKNVFKAFVGGLWQRFGSNTDVNQNPDANGFNYGAGVNAGPLQAGFTGYFGQGLGLYVPLENSPLFSDDSGVLRTSHGWCALAAVNVGGSKIAGGYGTEALGKTELEPVGPFPSQAVPKRQSGLSVGFYHSFKGPLVLALEFFQGVYQWYPLADPNGGAALNPQQVVNFVNVGLTTFF